MNDHEHELLSRHLDGELRGADRDAALALLEESSDARELLASMQEMDALAQEAFPRTRFQAPAQAKAHRPAVNRVAALAAAILVIVAGGLVYAAIEAGWIGWGTETDSQPLVVDGPETPREAVASEKSTTTQDGAGVSAIEATAPETVQSSNEPLLPGQVRNLDGTPVEEAQVYAVCGRSNFGELPKIEASATSGVDGRFELHYGPACDGILVLKTGFEPRWTPYESRIGGATVSVEVYLSRLARISGLVVTESGAPVAGTVVELQEFMWLEGLAGHAVTDESGTYRISARDGSHVWLSHPDYAWTQHQVSSDAASPAVLKPAGQMRVKVLKQGEPVVNALAMVSSKTQQLPRMLTKRTGLDGTALFVSLPPGTDYDVSTHTESGEFVGQPKGSTYVREGQVTECVLNVLSEQTAFSVSGTVFGPDGKPFGDAAVLACDEDVVARQTAVRPDGTYTLRLGAGVYSIGAFAPAGYGLMTRGTPVAVNASRTLDIALAPVERMRIAMRDGSGNPVTVAHLYERGMSLPSFVIRASDGTFDMTRFDRGVCLVDPATDMFAEASPVENPAGEALEVALNAPACAIAGRVVDTEGNPLPGAWVYAERKAETGTSGEFRLYPFRSDFVSEHITVTLPGYQELGAPPASLSAGTEPIEIVMTQKKAALAGHVTYLDGMPAKRAAVAVFKGRTVIEQLKTDATGTFRVKVAEGSDYRIEARAAGIRTELNGEVTAVTAPSENIELVLPEPSPEGYAEREDPQGPEYREAEESLKQMGAVFKMLAGEAQGGKFPGLDRRFGVLLPDLSALSPEYTTDNAILRHLEDRQKSKFVYFGYAVDSESMADTFLDAYEQYGPEGLTGEDINVDDAARQRGQRGVYQLREGVERFFITDINDPHASTNAQSRVPVMWELPGSHEEAGGYVLYLDGHTEWVPYPGPFPMTESLVTRIQGITAQAPK